MKKAIGNWQLAIGNRQNVNCLPAGKVGNLNSIPAMRNYSQTIFILALL